MNGNPARSHPSKLLSSPLVDPRFLNYINSYNRNPIIQDGPENNLIQQCLRGSVQTAAN